MKRVIPDKDERMASQRSGTTRAIAAFQDFQRGPQLRGETLACRASGTSACKHGRSSKKGQGLRLEAHVPRRADRAPEQYRAGQGLAWRLSRFHTSPPSHPKD